MLVVSSYMVVLKALAFSIKQSPIDFYAKPFLDHISGKCLLINGKGDGKLLA